MPISDAPAHPLFKRALSMPDETIYSIHKQLERCIFNPIASKGPLHRTGALNQLWLHY